MRRISFALAHVSAISTQHSLSKIFGALLLATLTAACPGTVDSGEGEGEGDEGEGESAGEGEGEEGEGEGTDGCTGVECPLGTSCSVDDEGNFLGCFAGEGEGEGEPFGECRTSADCTEGGTFCVNPDDPQQCGIPPPDFEDECASNADCDSAGGGGSVCDFVDDGCGGSHLACVTQCGLNPNCVAGEQCDCPDGDICNAGRCEARLCQNGDFVCASWEVCGLTAPDPLADDSDHGCVEIPCVDDGECPFGPPIPGGLVAVLGFCVNGVCASGPGSCEFPVP